LDIKFIPEAEKDYKSLDGSIKKIVNEKIDKLKDDAYIKVISTVSPPCL
jgi:mRNA-degrading endonuclease RelE of RelBE toxin-antitoxin system